MGVKISFLANPTLEKEFSTGLIDYSLPFEIKFHSCKHDYYFINLCMTVSFVFLWDSSKNIPSGNASAPAVCAPKSELHVTEFGLN